MSSVFLVIEPSLETAVKVLLDLASVGVNSSLSRDGDPVIGLCVKVSDVDSRVGFTKLSK